MKARFILLAVLLSLLLHGCSFEEASEPQQAIVITREKRQQKTETIKVTDAIGEALPQLVLVPMPDEDNLNVDWDQFN
jgi:outer membrane biogenesis lipoprotein LolB